MIGQNTHSRNIFSVHGFLNLSVIIYWSKEGIVESMWRQNQFIVNLKLPKFVDMGDTHL